MNHKLTLAAYDQSLLVKLGSTSESFVFPLAKVKMSHWFITFDRKNILILLLCLPNTGSFLVQGVKLLHIKRRGVQIHSRSFVVLKLASVVAHWKIDDSRTLATSESVLIMNHCVFHLFKHSLTLFVLRLYRATDAVATL